MPPLKMACGSLLPREGGGKPPHSRSRRAERKRLSFRRLLHDEPQLAATGLLGGRAQDGDAQAQLIRAEKLSAVGELRPLQARYADVLTTIGVHSPKFPHEAEHAAVTAAVQRYDVRHPVLDDPDLATSWSKVARCTWILR